MKILYLLSALLPSTALASSDHAAAATWGLINQTDPQNWAAGPQFLPVDATLGYYQDYTADSFALYVSNHCRQIPSVIASHTYSATYKGALKWVGVCLRANSGVSPYLEDEFIRIGESRVYGVRRN